MVGDQNVEWNADNVSNSTFSPGGPDALQYHGNRKELSLEMLCACRPVPAIPNRFAEQPPWLHGGAAGFPAARMATGGQPTQGHPTLPDWGAATGSLMPEK